MSFQVGIGSLDGTLFFRWDFVPLCELWISQYARTYFQMNNRNTTDLFKVIKFCRRSYIYKAVTVNFIQISLLLTLTKFVYSCCVFTVGLEYDFVYL